MVVKDVDAHYKKALEKGAEIVWNSCLKDRGYKVFSDPNN
jgi:hypothetical protein